MTIAINILSILLIVTGLFLFLGASVGLVRLPDFYTRMHAAGMGDTLSALLVVLGFAVYQLHGFHDIRHDWPVLLVILKLLAICVFIMVTSPASTHALMDAGYEEGCEPLTKEGGNALKEDLARTRGEDTHDSEEDSLS